MADTLTGDATLVLPEFDEPPAAPLRLLRTWLDAAVAYGVREAQAIVLATADAAGLPSSRVVLLKDLDEHGLVFTTHTGSRKGTDLAARPYASATFYWRETLQQIHVAGPVRQLPPGESDVLFAERPAAAQATTAASRQSTPLDDEAALRQRAADLLATGGSIARPDGWAGYRLEAAAIEFWHGSVDRLHRRLRYDRHPGGWTAQRLQP
ncbi:phenazine biosynthesis FMN-dependent oxidase PhzG [Dactylosporangium sp. NPDC000555]|uniref:phenazine biosynthesis FMN-dependent oxidase PhzG n=1 Tax=Dactylosporangium sp. NPDC000555 TaxID=3154260 RepID=UPI00332C94BE